MSEQTPTSKPDEADVTAAESVDPNETDTTAAASTSTPEPADEPASAGEAEPAATPVEPVAAATPAAAEPSPQQVVYVQAPVPPKVRGNRVVGVLLALLGAVIFAAVYAAAAAIPISLRYSGSGFSPAFSAFLQDAIFWIPIMMFALGFVVVTVILNRAGWWAHVIGSVVVALFVYFVSIGLLLLVRNVVAMTPSQAASAFGALATNPLLIAAALVAREVSIWMGLAIAARGRRVKARNVEARAAFDREQAEKKAQYGAASS